MESERLDIRPMQEEDESSFTAGISDRSLRVSYGFPAEADPAVLKQIFQHFYGIQCAYSLVRRDTGEMIGFLLDVESELPVEAAEKLPGRGRTLAYSVFPPFQRKGYMEEALRAYIPCLEVSYIHCGHFPENESSRRLLDKLGFHEFFTHQIGSRTVVDEVLLTVRETAHGYIFRGAAQSGNGQNPGRI